MAMKLDQLLDIDFLRMMIQKGYVREQHHPKEPLTIYNYSHAAQYDRLWNEVTRQCRGLIVDDDDNVVARPWPKFFNYGEHAEDEFDLSAEVVVRDKLDGSLGILYPSLSTTSGFAIATRGSFTSEQAVRGTEMLQGYLTQPRWTPLPGVTYLFEIIYPENRIVIDYGGRSELVLLGIVDNDSGDTDHGDTTWPGPVAPFIWAETLAEALALPPRPNSEGVVVRFKDTKLMIKLKQDDYVALHRIVTGLSERTVWEHLSSGQPIEELLRPLPEEFVSWVTDVSIGLCHEFVEITTDAQSTYSQIVTQVSLSGNRDWTRKEFAAYATERTNPHLLFMLLDGKPIDEAVWKMLQPSNPRALVSSSEDTA
jgi:RNA ligase